MMHSIFLLQKAKIIFLLFMYTNKSRPFTIPIIFMTEEVASTVGRGINPVIAQRRMRTL